MLYAFSFMFVAVTMKDSLLLSGLTRSEDELQNITKSFTFLDSGSFRT